MSKLGTVGALCGIVAMSLFGCSGGENISKEDLDRLNHPSKQLPPQLAETMKYANQAASNKGGDPTKPAPVNIPPDPK